MLFRYVLCNFRSIGGIAPISERRRPENRGQPHFHRSRFTNDISNRIGTPTELRRFAYLQNFRII